MYRRVDFTRSPAESASEVVRLEWDPNRSAHIALLRQVRQEGEHWCLDTASRLISGGMLRTCTSGAYAQSLILPTLALLCAAEAGFFNQSMCGRGWPCSRMPHGLMHEFQLLAGCQL